ncbi:MAG: metallophosphoesterase family protein [Dehalococcoidales bacterium]
MRIGLISDTHIPEVEYALPDRVMEVFQGVDLILHAGDIYALNVLDDLEGIAPVLAALGDDDYAGVGKRVKKRHILELEGQVLWLQHISPLFVAPEGKENETPPESGPNASRPDIIISGHEHRTMVERSGGVLYINSGSPTLLNYKKGLGTVGILELSAGKADVEIIRL